MLLSLIMATDVDSTVQYVSAHNVFSHILFLKRVRLGYFFNLKLDKEVYRVFNNWNS